MLHSVEELVWRQASIPRTSWLISCGTGLGMIVLNATLRWALLPP
jgi:hypothetical protein